MNGWLSFLFYKEKNIVLAQIIFKSYSRKKSTNSLTSINEIRTLDVLYFFILFSFRKVF